MKRTIWRCAVCDVSWVDSPLIVHMTCYACESSYIQHAAIKDGTVESWAGLSDEFLCGWDDCRAYAGEDKTRAEDYKAGFSACLRAWDRSGNIWDHVNRPQEVSYDQVS